MASIKLKGDTSGEVTIQAPAVAGTTTLNLPATSSTLATQNALGVRNLIINGDMRIAQRGTSATGITTSGYNTVDRWTTRLSSVGTWTETQDTNVPTGQGFPNSVKLQCTTANASLGASSLFILQYRFEGQNLQHLKKGTSNAESVTLSFWIKSNKTGTYIVDLYDIDNTRTISKAYTIDTADTWEKKTLTYAGDTSGAFDNDNERSMDINMWLAAGSDYSSGTLNTSWKSAVQADRAVGQVNLADSTSNYINITGVQLEVGDTATPFEHRPYDMELQRCQRYYWKNVYNSGNPAPTFMACAIGYTTTNIGQAHCKLPVTMRASPSSSISSNLLWWNSPTGSITAIASTNNTVDIGVLNFTTTGVSAGSVYNIISTTVGTYIDFSAEL
jgi:hypothetical protein